MSLSGDPVIMFRKLNYQIADRSETIGQPRLTSMANALHGNLISGFQLRVARK